jgi:glycosyltransferase involved in cell wall biosynthesis
MNSEPRVSVIMAAYNAEKFLRQAVDSILAQTLADFELILVDDASTDGTRAILVSYSDPRIRALYNPSNLGQSATRNRALAAARGKYIAVLDADDIALPTRLEKQGEWLDSHPQVGLLGGYAVTIDDLGNERDCAPTDDTELKWRLLSGNPFIHSSVMIRKSVLDQSGGYSNEECIRRAFVEDYELLSRLNRLAPAAVLPEVLVKYRIHAEGASIRTAAEQKQRVEDVARRNIAWLTGYPVSDAAWEGLRRMNLNWAPLSAGEARAALELDEAKHVAFARRYLDCDSARARLRRYRLVWARRAFAQARRNPYLDDRCRSVMLRAAGKLLAGLVSVPRFSRRAGSSEKIAGTIL